MWNVTRTVVVWAALAAALCAQDISKSQVFLEAGKTDKVVIAVPGCKPTWTATSDNPAITVSPTSVSGKEKVVFKIRADKELFSESATITVRIEDPECLVKPIDVDLRAFAVMDDKGAEKSFKKSVKTRQKALKSELKAAQKDFDVAIKDVLAGVKDGSLEDGSPEQVWNTAFLAVMLALFTAYTTMFQSYRSYLGGCASDGRQALSLYGFVPLLALLAPLAFMTGGCGLWDDARLGGFGLLVGALGGLFGSMKKFEKKLSKLVPVLAVMTVLPFLMVDFSATIPDPTSSNAGSTSGLDERVRIVGAAAINATTTSGVDVGESNQFTSDESNGQIVAMGRAEPGADVDLVAGKQGTGAPDGIGAVTTVTADGNGFWYAELPDDGPGLPPGTYVLTASSEGDTDRAAIAIRNSLD